ncbi:MAG: ATP phosphoribosyltransferase regulatory subunit, partial [Myxococcales bacterium]
RTSLVDYFEGHKANLSEDSRARLQRNPLRILDSKDPKDREICAGAPSVDEHLTAEASDFFAAVTAGIDAAGVPWTRNARLVRGLDYYRHTAFEFVTDRLGAQGTLIAGGRYDGLVEALGGPHTPAVGWAAGIERLAMMIESPEAETIGVAVVAENETREAEAIQFAAMLRRSNIAVELYVTGSPRKRYDRALRTRPGAIVSLDVREGVRSGGFRMLKSESDMARRAHEIWDKYGFKP